MQNSSSFKLLLGRFRTWQIRHCLFWAASVNPRVTGIPVWYASDVQVTPVAGVVTSTHLTSDGFVPVKLFFESPLGTEIKLVSVPVNRLTYRPT